MKKVLLSLLVIVFSLGVVHAQPAGWLYEKPFAVTNSSPQLILNYTMAVTVNTQALISAHKMQDSGQDIRFGTPCDGTRMFNYFIDSGINTATTLIYVTIDSLKPNSTRTIYMFYGNPDTTAASNYSALDGPYTMFNGQDYSSYSTFINNTCCGAHTDTTQTGVYFQPNKKLLVTALGAFSPFGIFTQTIMQLSQYDPITLSGAVVANKAMGTFGSTTWTFVDLAKPILLNPDSTYGVSIALDDDFNDYYGGTTSIPPTSSQVSVLGYVNNSFFITPTAVTAPFANPSSSIAGYTDIKYYLQPVPNSYVTYIPDTQINGSAYIDPVNKLVCPGTNTTFTSIASGQATTYQWQVNNGNSWVNLSSNSLYTGVNQSVLTISGATAVQNGYQYRAYMTSTCGTGYSNPATLSINTSPAVTPVANITGPNPACQYTNATYTVVTNVQSPTYAWYKYPSAVNPVSTASQYGFVPNPGDQVYAVVTTPNNAAIACYTVPVAVSNQVSPVVGSNFTPYDSVAASSNNGCSGVIVDYTGYGNVYGGSYQWYVNSQPVAGATASTYSYAPNNGDLVTEVVNTPANGCYNTTNVTSQPVVATTQYGVTPTIQLSAPKTAIDDQVVTVTANISNYGGGNYTIYWANASTYIDTTHNVNYINFKKSPRPTIDYISARIVPVTPYNGTCYNAVTTATPLEIDFTPYNEGVGNVANNNGISVYPNPFTSKVSVNGLKAGDKLVVYDMAGRSVSTVYEATGTTGEYMLSDLAAGHYILRVTDGDGTTKANLPVSKL